MIAPDLHRYDLLLDLLAELVAREIAEEREVEEWAAPQFEAASE